MRMLGALLLVGLSSILSSGGAQAQLNREIQLDIQSQILVDALNEWAQAAGFRLIGPGAATRSIVSPRVRGSYTPQAALDQLLSGTNLTYEFIDERTVAIRESTATSARVATTPINRMVGENRPSRLTLADSQNTGVLPDKPAPNDVESAGDSKRQRVALETVIVTAQKRAERLQDVPISISVLQGDDLDRFTVEGVRESLTLVPGVTIAQVAEPLAGGGQIAVRGVAASASFLGGSSPVAYYIDSVPFGMVKTAEVPDSGSYDLQRVEVLRGPQGTLYGASALNGVVRILTQDADPNQLDFKVRTMGSSTKEGGENYRADMAANVPIVEGKWAARAVAGYQDLSGWIDNFVGEDKNDAEIRNLRLKVNGKPTDELSVGLFGWVSRSDYGALAISDDHDQYPGGIDQPYSSDYDAFGVRVGYQFPGFSLTSMTSYIDFESQNTLDLTPFAVLDTYYTNLKSRVLSQEFIVSSSTEGPWRWSGGGFYRDAEDDLFQNGIILVAPFDFTDTSKSYALFGEVTRVLMDGEFELTGGLRYFKDEVEQIENSPHSGVATDPLYRKKDTFDAISPRAVLTWHPNDQTTVYASYSEGFRSGYNQSAIAAAIDPNLPPVKEDTLRNYEIGTKGNWLAGRIGYDAAVYYIDWKDVQQFVAVEITPGSYAFAGVNGESASGIGVDLSTTFRVLEGLQITLGGSYNDLTLDGPVNSGGRLLFAKGERLSNSSEYTVGGSADYSFPLGRNGYEGLLSASSSYTSARPVRALLGNEVVYPNGDSMSNVRVSFAIEAPAHWSASIFVDNATNERGSPVRSEVPVWSSRVRPRTFGLQLDYRY